MKKLVSLILALFLLSSAVLMTACDSTEDETNSSDGSDGSEAATDALEVIPDTPYPVDRLTIDGKPIEDFVIAYSSDAGESVRYAAAELKEYIALTCGADLEIVEDAPAGTLRILIDGTQFSDTDDFKYYSDADGIVIAGEDKRGAVYAVYNFLENCLGWRFFAADCEVCYEASSIDLKDVSYEQNFTYEIRDIYWTEYFDNDISLKRYQNGEGKRRGILGGAETFHPNGIHTMDSLAKTGGDGGSSGGQPCLNDEEVYATILQSVKDWLDSSGQKAVHVSQNDNDRYCTCEKCSADIDYYGAPSGSFVKLVNRLDDDLKASGYDGVKIIIFAYHYTFECPKNIVCNDDIVVEICTINNCYNHAYNDASCPTNADCMKQIDAWAEICDEFYIWDYTINYKYYLSPFANFDVLLENINYLNTIGAKGIILQGNYQTISAEFGALRCYLLAKVLENPTMTEEEYYGHMDEFLAAYYGEGWVNVRKFIDLMNDLSNTTNNCYNIFSSPEEMFGDHALEPFNEILLEWWDEAEALAGDDLQLEHVRRSRLCCDYLRIGAIHHQAYDVRDAMRETVQEYHAELVELGITRIAENCELPNKAPRDTNPRAWWSLHEYEE